MPRSLHGISQFAVPAVLLLLVLLTFAAPGKLGGERSLPVQAEQTIALSDRYRISVAESAPELLPCPARHRPGRPGRCRLPAGRPPPASRVPATSAPRCGRRRACGRPHIRARFARVTCSPLCRAGPGPEVARPARSANNRGK